MKLKKCGKCKNEFDITTMTKARNEHGKYPISPKAQLYCRSCEENIYQMNLLKDYLHRGFIHKGYYSAEDNSDVNKATKSSLMKMVSKQIQNMEADGYTCEQIRLVLEHMLTKEDVEFTDAILGLVPYYFMRTKRYHGEMFRIRNSAKFGYIEPTKVESTGRQPHRPNKKALRLTDMGTL